MLQKMMDTQETFQKRLGTDILLLAPEKRTTFIKEHSIHLSQELHELLYELPYFKPWKDYSQMSSKEVANGFSDAAKEFIDLWHFVLNIALALGFTEKTLAEDYFEKHKENNARQDAGYDHTKRFRDE